ncbi:MAG: presqualene diphosphate synthase HpnD [Pseudonocardia sp.]|nr:presqualene diphosphate synthase HpnD [Pseudonocardia sp.]
MTEVATGTVADAYRMCESITRTEARNFYYGIRLLRPRRRAAMSAIYALARRIDDIGDGNEVAPAERLDALDAVHRSLADLTHASDPVLVAVHDAAHRFPIPLTAFEELIDGVRMDVTGRRYTHFEELVEYCRCVAGSIGRLCLAVFEARPDPNAPLYADQLGIALQQTNILRDIREDLTNGRVYLPTDDLDRFSVALELDERGALADPDGGLAKLIQDGAARAGRWYADGMRLLPLLDRRSGACCAAMSGIYRRLLDRIAEHPERVYDRRLSLSGWEKAGVAARALGRSHP